MTEKRIYGGEGSSPFPVFEANRREERVVFAIMESCETI